jgi:hypothetical protein
MSHEDGALSHFLHASQDAAFPALVIRIGLVWHGRVTNLVVWAEIAAKAFREPRIILVCALGAALNEQNLLCHCRRSDLNTAGTLIRR